MFDTDDLRATLEAAMAGDGDGGNPAAEQAAAPGAASEGAEGQSQGAAQAGGAQGRDAAGKFAPSAEGAEQNEAAKAAASQEPQDETIRAPHSLPAPLKAKWGGLDPDVRNAFVQLEASTKAAKDEWAQKAERLNRLDGVLAPRREMLTMRGLDESQAIQALFAAQDLLERNPLEGISYLARSYGVNLAQVAAQMSGQGQGGGQALALPPEHLQPILQKVQTLEQQVQAQTQAERQLREGEAAAQIEAFRNDPAHPYFDNVRGQMKALLESGQASTLADAYESACWGNPEIRGLLIQEQAKKTQDAAAKAERERAAKAAQAAGSVTGAPGAAKGGLGNGSSGSIRDDLAAAWEQHAV